MLKNARVLLIVLALSLLLVACEQAAPAADSGGDSADSADSGEMMAESVCNVEAPAEAVELNLIGWPFEIMDFYTAEILSLIHI